MANKIDLFAQKTDGESMRWEDPQSVEKFRQEADPGRYLWQAKRSRPPKSQKQLGDTFGNAIKKVLYEANDVRQDGIDGLVQYFKQLNLPKNIEATKDIVMKVFYTVAPTFNDEGEEITLSKMDTKQATDFMRRVKDAMAGYVYIPDPDPNWRDKEKQQTQGVKL